MKFQDDEFLTKSVENVLSSYELLVSSDWKLEKTTECGDKIFYLQRKPYGKIYRITAEINYPAKELFDSLIAGVEDMPKWNPTIIESRILRVSYQSQQKLQIVNSLIFSRVLCFQRIDEHVDITYQAAAPSAGGLVNSRDFVNLRSWHILRDGKITAGTSPTVTHISSSCQPSSSTAIWDSNGDGSDMDDVTVTGPAPFSLAKSLGARSFGGFETDQSPSTSTKDQPSSTLTSAEADTSNLVYITSAVAIEYVFMPPLPKYTRYEYNIC